MNETQEQLHKAFVDEIRLGAAVQEMAAAMQSLEASMRFVMHMAAAHPAAEKALVALSMAAATACRVQVTRIVAQLSKLESSNDLDRHPTQRAQHQVADTT